MRVADVADIEMPMGWTLVSRPTGQYLQHPGLGGMGLNSGLDPVLDPVLDPAIFNGKTTE